jgi:limonene-1,2-epoxide hydrolase
MPMITRRSFFAAGGLAAVLGNADPLAQTAAETATERSNAKTVNTFCAAWAARDIEALMPYFADNATYRITETSPPLVGRTVIHDRVKPIIDRMTSIEYKVSETIAKGPIVLTERVDTFISPQRTQRYHVMGMFYLADGKIVEWTDYIIKDL